MSKTIMAPGEMKMTEMSEMWPQLLTKNKHGFWVECRDVKVGPFETKREADKDMGRLQAEIMGWDDPVKAKIFEEGGSWFVDRWYIDGPFDSEESAKAHKTKLILDQLLEKEGEGMADLTVTPVPARQLNQDDIPALMSLVMDRLGITEFHFTVKELTEVEGRISLDHEDVLKASYVMRRLG